MKSDRGSGEYLALVVGGNRDSRHIPLRFLRPSHMMNADGSSWEELDEPAEELFPPRAQVIWMGALEEATEGSLWRISVEDNPREDALDHRKVGDRFSPVTEVLDLRVAGSDEMARRLVTKTGLDHPTARSRRYYLWLEKTLLAGPVHFLRDPSTSRLFAHADDLKEPLRIFRTESPQEVTCADGVRRLVLHPGSQPVPLGQRDWGEDSTVVARALQRLGKINKESAKALDLTERAIEQLIEELDIATDEEYSNDLHMYRVQRASNVISTRSLATLTLMRFAATISQMPDVQERLEQLVQEERDRILEDAKTEAGDIVRSVTDQAEADLEAIRKDADAERARLSALKSQVSEAEQELERVKEARVASEARLSSDIDALTPELELKLTEVLERPQSLLAQIAILRAAGALTQSTPERTGPARTLSDFWMLPTARPAKEIAQPRDLSKLLNTPMNASGLARHAGIDAVSALLAGGFGVTGPEGRHLWDAVATAITSGRSLRVQVAPTMSEPGDLLGRCGPSGGEFAPDPFGLLDLLLAARESSDLHLVVLDGINLAPADAYLLPVLRAYWATAARAVAPPPIRLAHPSRLPERYERAAMLDWPKNVLLAGTLADGPACLPLPAELWDGTVLLHTVELDRDYPGNYRPERETDAGQIPALVWEEWRDGLGELEDGQWDVFLESCEEEPSIALPAVQGRFADRLCRASTFLNEEALIETYVECVIAQWLVPRAAGHGQLEETRALLESSAYLTGLVPSAFESPALKLVGRA